MKRSTKGTPGLLMACLCGATMLMPPLACAAEHEFHGFNDLSITYSDVTGQGASQSSLTEGVRYLDLLTLTGSGKTGGLHYSWHLGGKATDDPRNDLKKYSLTNLQGRFSNRIHALTLGDTFESFSQYSLNTALKGGSYRLTPAQPHLPQLIVLYGTAYSRWDNFWGVDAVRRRVAGGKVRQNVGEEFTLGVSGVLTDDSPGGPERETADHRTVSVDWEYRPFPGLTISGESAWLDGERRVVGTPAADYNGSAHKASAVGDGGPSRVTLEYERVDPGFRTQVASASPDRERFKARWRYRYSKDLTVTSSMLWYRDNLDGQKAYRTDHYKPEVAFSLKRPFQRTFAVADLSYKYDRSSSRAIEGVDHYATIGYRDRFGPLDSDTSLGFIRYDREGGTRQKDDEFTYNTTLSSRHTVGRFVLKPAVYLGGWTRNDELAESTDQIVEYSAGLGVDVPLLKLYSNFKAGNSRLVKDTGTDAARAFASANLFWRPDALAALQGVLYAKGAVNDLSYDPNAAGGSRDFRESSLTAGVTVQF